MPDVERWPAPPGEPVLVLAHAATTVERDAIERWILSARPSATPPDLVETIPLADPEASHTTDPPRWMPRFAPATTLAHPGSGGVAPAEHDGDRSVRIRDVVLNLGDPRRPRRGRQRRIVHGRARPVPRGRW